MEIVVTNKNSQAFKAFMRSVEMRKKWEKAVRENYSIEEMKKEGIIPINIVE